MDFAQWQRNLWPVVNWRVVPRYVPPNVIPTTVTVSSSALAVRKRRQLRHDRARQFMAAQSGYLGRLAQLQTAQVRQVQASAGALNRAPKAPSQAPKGPSGSAPGAAPPVATPTKDSIHEHDAAQSVVTVERAVAARILGVQFPP